MPVANVFEGLVVLAQIACLARNYTFMSAGKTEEEKEDAANEVYAIMMISVAAMMLRLVAVMAPAFWRAPWALHMLVCKLPRQERARAGERKRLERAASSLLGLSSVAELRGMDTGDLERRASAVTATRRSCPPARRAASSA